MDGRVTDIRRSILSPIQKFKLPKRVQAVRCFVNKIVGRRDSNHEQFVFASVLPASFYNDVPHDPFQYTCRGFLTCVCFEASQAKEVEHPGSLQKDSDCASCHVKKMIGKSVHSAMQAPCGVCHVTATHGDMTLVNLSMPKNKICFACHEAASASRLHTSSVQAQCLECHDAHSSNYPMLLRREAWTLSTNAK